MSNRILIGSFLAYTALFAGGLFAQDTPDLTGIPAPRGIYYHAARGWVILSASVLEPWLDGRPAALQVLNVGSDHTVAQLPGSHAGTQIAGDVRPTFYLHGISPEDLYLVQITQKEGYREVRMPISRRFGEWAHFRAKDLTDFDIVAVNGDIVAIKPGADLKPGEYTLASVMASGYRWLRVGHDFGIVTVSTGQ